MFIKYNPNPKALLVGDCVVRAISTAMNMEWEDVYVELADKGLEMKDMPSSNNVWGSYLLENGFIREVVPFDNYTVREFCKDHPKGTFILATGSHVVTTINGDYFDTWNSGDEEPIYYFRRENRHGL